LSLRAERGNRELCMAVLPMCDCRVGTLLATTKLWREVGGEIVRTISTYFSSYLILLPLIQSFKTQSFNH
jgi:hypothetical protein